MELNPQNQTKAQTGPLWLRTKRRLDRMATWSAQRTPMSLGSDERIGLREERIACASRELVLRLKRWEEGTPEPWYPEDAGLRGL